MTGALLAWANYAFKLGVNIEWFFTQVVLRLLNGAALWMGVAQAWR